MGRVFRDGLDAELGDERTDASLDLVPDRSHLLTALPAGSSTPSRDSAFLGYRARVTAPMVTMTSAARTISSAHGCGARD